MTVVFLLFCLGILLGRLRTTPPSAASMLDWFVIRVALPALIVDRVRELTIGQSTLIPIAAAWFSGALVAVIVLAVAWKRGWESSVTGAVLLCATLGNTSFLGLPATLALLGPTHLPAAIVYDQLGTFLALATWGAYVAARFGSDRPDRRAGIVRRVLTFPPFGALCVGGLLGVVELPAVAAEPFDDALGVLAAAVTPLAIVSVGLRFRVPSADRIGPTAIGIVLKMAVAPGAVIAVGSVLGGSGVEWEVAALQAAAPPMVTASVLACDSGLDESAATSMTSFGLLLAFATLPLVARMVT